MITSFFLAHAHWVWFEKARSRVYVDGEGVDVNVDAIRVDPPSAAAPGRRDGVCLVGRVISVGVGVIVHLL
jgi:hypothetical protein